MQLLWRLLGLPWHHLLLLALHRLHLLLLAGCVTAVTRNVPNLPALIARFCSLPSWVAHATLLLLLVLLLLLLPLLIWLPRIHLHSAILALLVTTILAVSTAILAVGLLAIVHAAKLVKAVIAKRSV